MKKFCDWIINNFTYVQIYVFICFLFLISLFPIVYYWIETHVEHLQSINDQLNELEEEKILANTFNLLEQHRLLTLRYYVSDKEIMPQILNLQKHINQNFNILEKEYDFGKQEQLTQDTLLWKKMFPREIKRSWEAITNNFSTLSERQNESLQTVLLQEMNIMFDYLSNRVGISYFEQKNHYTFIQSLSLRLPTFQEELSQLILISEKILMNRSKELARDRSQALIDSLKSDISYFENILGSQTSAQITSTKHEKGIELLKEYLNLTAQFIQTIQTHILNTADPTISLIELKKITQDILPTGLRAWQQDLDALIRIFQKEKNYILSRLWIILIITILLTAFAFYLGLSLLYKGILRLSQLTQATNHFTKGNLSARVPDTYQDEIGKQAKAFNRMAQRLEELINHLYELIDATSDLSKGQLTARIPLRQDNSEFNQVAISFNKMAETFDTIIGRLKQIGQVLTTSASEIASASQEQEIIIIEQEATTREIASAANEISSTAKEFAHTMNEVSLAAEQTSHLALKGKGSLNNMESIMSHMVEASSTIAGKLAVLNEKANNITSVITTINKVADQTNLLSLNASIEAEKAGEYGRSFAVIAREIRRLADQSAIATLDVEKMVNEIMTAVSSSVKGMDDFTQEIRKGVGQVRSVSEHLGTIIEHVQIFTARFDLINQGMQAQSTGAEQINEAIAQLSQSARHTTEAIHQFHKTIQELNQAANELSILNPFAKSSSEEISSPESTQMIPILEQPTRESKGEMGKTLTNLNVTAAKLKNLNIQLRPAPPQEKDHS